MCGDSAVTRASVATATGRSHALIATLCALALVVGCGRRDENAQQGVPLSAAAPSAVVATTPLSAAASSAGVTTTALALAILPPAALAALRESAPTFTSLERSSYPDSIASSAHESQDDGLVFLRADRQGLGRTDYAVAGLDQGTFRVIALLAAADGTFRAVEVTTLTPDWKLIPGVPALLLERAECYCT